MSPQESKSAQCFWYMSSVAAISVTGLVWMGSQAIAGDGVAGAAGALGSSASGTYTNSTSVTGGNGTNGGNATGNSNQGMPGFTGGVGGAGGTGILGVSGATITNDSSITGGRGGNSGNGSQSSGSGGPGGVGGTGGAGGTGLSGSNLTITNNAVHTIIGGLGGIGGNGALAWGPFLGGNGGAGGVGGAGIVASSAMITNSGTIRGGNGGTGGAGGTSGNGGGFILDPGLGGATGVGGSGIAGAAVTIINTVSGLIGGGAGGAGISGSDLIVSNAGVIGSVLSGFGFSITGGTNNIENTGTILASVGSSGIMLQGGNTTITNIGTISGGPNSFGNGNGIDISAGTASIINLGTISVDTLWDYGISVTGTGNLVSLSNAQGGVTPLTYRGILPTNYNVIIHSLSSYGQLVGSSLTGSTRFGVAAGSTLALGTYAGVLQGLTSQNIDANTLTGRMGRYRWLLAEDANPNTVDTWDLTVVRGGPDSVNTSLALQSNASAVRGLLSQRIATITNALDYDCGTFDAKGYCVSFRARYTGMDTQNEGAGVLAAAYRANANLRIGSFVDYRANERMPTGLKQGDTMPTFGVFAVYSERGDVTGLQVKSSIAYNSGKITTTRANILPDTEPGSGKAQLSSYAIGAELGWGIALSPTALATPYAGIRHTDATRYGYSENTTATVEYPIAYNAYYQRLTTATVGVRLAGMFSDKLGYQASFGAEYDVAHKASSYSGTSTIPDLETFALANTSSASRARVVASTGLYYQLDKTQRLTATVGVRGQAYSSQPSVTTMVGYQMAF